MTARGFHLDHPVEPRAAELGRVVGRSPLDQAERYSSATRKARSSDWLAVEPRVAGRLVALVQVVLEDLVAAADALGDVVAGELDVDAAGVGAERAVDLEEALDLVQHVVEAAGLVAAGRLEGVAVHRVADPGDLGAARR